MGHSFGATTSSRMERTEGIRLVAEGLRNRESEGRQGADRGTGRAGGRVAVTAWTAQRTALVAVASSVNWR